MADRQRLIKPNDEGEQQQIKAAAQNEESVTPKRIDNNTMTRPHSKSKKDTQEYSKITTRIRSISTKGLGSDDNKNWVRYWTEYIIIEIYW